MSARGGWRDRQARGGHRAIARAHPGVEAVALGLDAHAADERADLPGRDPGHGPRVLAQDIEHQLFVATTRFEHDDLRLQRPTLDRERGQIGFRALDRPGRSVVADHHQGGLVNVNANRRRHAGILSPRWRAGASPPRPCHSGSIRPPHLSEFWRHDPWRRSGSFAVSIGPASLRSARRGHTRRAYPQGLASPCGPCGMSLPHWTPPPTYKESLAKRYRDS
jgi:hypothetical protein